MGSSYTDGVHREWKKDVFGRFQVNPDGKLQGASDYAGAYMIQTRKQYEDKSPADFIHLKDYAAGDGKTDDTAGLQKALTAAIGAGKILFADAGVYLLSDTIPVPVGAHIVGEAWTQFAATGPKFGDTTNPKVLFQVAGGTDKSLNVEMQDIIITSKGPTPGLIGVQWGVAYVLGREPSSMWDVHFRLGGALGTDLTPAECPALKTGEVKDECKVATLMMWIPPWGSGYFENVWLWVADHMIDDPDLEDDKNEMTMLSVFCARGWLIESKDPVLLYGTASEHSVMYQYSIYNASHVFGGFLQTESPYFQPSPPAPEPFTGQVGYFYSDPSFRCVKGANWPSCDSSWGLVVTKSQDVYIAGAGIYSWFSTYSEDCIDSHACQGALVDLRDNRDKVVITNLVTIGANRSTLSDGASLYATDDLTVKEHPSWSQISYLVSYNTGGLDGDDDYKPLDCDAGPAHLQGNLDSLSQSAPDEWLPCAPEWAMRILATNLTTALERFHSVDDDNYDEKFGAYATHLDKSIGPAIEKAMNIDDGECNKFFDCTLVVHQTNGHDSAPWTKTCPFTRVDLLNLNEWTMTYTLKDAAGFNKTVAEKYGITPDWVKFADNTIKTPASGGHPRTSFTTVGKPAKADACDISNPKDVIVKSLEGYKTLQATIVSTWFEMRMRTWKGPYQDPVRAYVLPVAMLYDAIDNMIVIARIGAQEIEDDLHSFITDIVTAALLLIPFAGELVGPLVDTAVGLGRAITLFELGSQGGLGMYDLITDHNDDAVMDFPGLMIGVGTAVKGFGREAEEMADLTKVRNRIKDSDIDKMGGAAKRNNDLISSVMNKCVRKA